MSEIARACNERNKRNITHKKPTPHVLCYSLVAFFFACVSCDAWRGRELVVEINVAKGVSVLARAGSSTVDGERCSCECDEGTDDNGNNDAGAQTVTVARPIAVRHSVSQTSTRHLAAATAIVVVVVTLTLTLTIAIAALTIAISTTVATFATSSVVASLTFPCSLPISISPVRSSRRIRRTRRSSAWLTS